jgi:hypothetical protein
MKTLKCDLCDATAQGETFEDWMRALMPHFMEAHGDLMKAMGEKPEEEQKAEKEKWMVENGARFDAA